MKIPAFQGHEQFTYKTAVLFVFHLSLNRITVVAAHVWTMEPVKLDSPVGVFDVSVALDLQEQTVIKVN